MHQGIDHIVVVVSNLATAVANYTRLGFTVVPGGRHPTGTHNALIAFADGAYIELIAFYDPSPTHRWWPWLQKGGGLVDFCLRTDNIEVDAAAWRAAGVALSDLTPLSRTRPDGYRLEWVLAMPAGRFQGLVPFLIADQTPRTERVPGQTRHANQVIGVVSLTFAVSDQTAVQEWYGQVLGQRGEPLATDDAAGIRFTIGPHSFDFVRPTNDASALAAHLWRRGPSLFSAVLHTAERNAGPLDPSLALGANLELAN